MKADWPIHTCIYLETIDKETARFAWNLLPILASYFKRFMFASRPWFSGVYLIFFRYPV